MEVKALDPRTFFTKDGYYKDRSCASFSLLKLYSKCETLCRDIFVTKVYEEPEHDYFIYGNLVDALLTESAQYLSENFVRVERRVNPEDALRIENKIKDLETEILEKEAKIEEKLGEKKAAETTKVLKLRSALNDKILKKPDADYSKDLAKITEAENALPGKLEEIMQNADKTLVKGIETRRANILEEKEKLALIASLVDKQQVTGSIWENAEETALALRTHPSFAQMEFNSFTSQQVFAVMADGVPFKGKLDHLKLSPALTKLYSIYISGQMTLEDMQTRIREDVHADDLWAIITDIKTCRDLKSLEPWSTHYRGQLGTYQVLVGSTLLIPKENIRCRILVADKINNSFKKAELLEYTQASLDELQPNIWEWARYWKANALDQGIYVSDKAKRGWNQECFTCTECRLSPFSNKVGEPVLVSGPRFGGETPRPLTDADGMTTADAVLEY